MNPIRRKSVARSHQIEATKKILAVFKKKSRTQCIMACGTGKTLVSLHVAEQGKFKTVVVFVPSLALVSQVLKEYRLSTSWKKWSAIAVCSDETVAYDYNKVSPEDVGCAVVNNSKTVRQFLAGDGVRVVFCTYHSTPILKKLEFELGIFDEAHKTAGAKDKAFGFALHDRNVKINRRLFLTATPRHVKLSEKQEDEGETVYSMDDEAMYGTPAFKLTLGDAIQAGLVCDYKIVICPLLEDIDVEADSYTAAQVALRRAMYKFKAKRAITFHGDIARAQRFAADAKGALKGLAKWHINGSMSADERKKHVDGMIKKGGIITNVRCLSEGVDFPAVDSIAFIDPKRSAIDIVQSVGRCLRIDTSNRNKLGTILVPVYIKRGESDEDAIARTRFGHLFDILQSLKETDPKLGDELRRKASGGKREPNDRIEVLPLIDGEGKSSGLKLETLQRAITVRLFSSFNSYSKYKKEKLLEMAVRGEPRPFQKTTLGSALGIYTNESRGSYCSEFDGQIRKLAPHWFKKSSDMNKEKLLEMAKRGEPKPSRKTKLGNALKTYIVKSETYDLEFDQHIHKLAPDWFVDSSRENKNKLLKIASGGKPRPDSKKSKLGANLGRYLKKDPLFAAQIRKLNPSWILVKKSITLAPELLDLAREGRPRPHYLSALGKYLNYIIRMRNDLYVQTVKLAPHWFR